MLMSRSGFIFFSFCRIIGILHSYIIYVIFWKFSKHFELCHCRVDFTLKEDFDNQAYVLDVAMFR